MGRIYRVYPADKKLRPIPNLKKLSTAKLVAALDTPNGTERDLIHIELVQRGDTAAVRPLMELAAKSKLPAVRIQALCALDGLKALTPAVLQTALADTDAHVRRQAIRLSETQVGTSPAIQEALLKLVDDPDVRYQLALSLGEWNDPRAGQALGKLAQAGMGDGWIRAAILSSAVHQPAEILKGVLAAAPKTRGRGEMVDQLIATVVGQNNPETLGKVLATVAPKEGQEIEDWQFSVLKSLLDALERKKLTFASYAASATGETREAVERIKPMFEAARKLAGDASARESSREVAIHLLGHEAEHQEADLQLLGGLLKPANTLAVAIVGPGHFEAHPKREVPGLLLADWKQHSPSLRAPILEILMSREESIKSIAGRGPKPDSATERNFGGQPAAAVETSEPSHPETGRDRFECRRNQQPRRGDGAISKRHHVERRRRQRQNAFCKELHTLPFAQGPGKCGGTQSRRCWPIKRPAICCWRSLIPTPPLNRASWLMILKPRMTVRWSAW